MEEFGRFETLDAVRNGDALIVSKIDVLARSATDAGQIGDLLPDHIKLQLGPRHPARWENSSSDCGRLRHLGVDPTRRALAKGWSSPAPKVDSTANHSTLLPKIPNTDSP